MTQKLAKEQYTATKAKYPSDSSVSDNGCAHQMALKNNSVCHGVLMGTNG
jgi:hypothetical protein